MQNIDMGALASQVLWATFGLSLLFGAIAQRTHFCTMGAVADIVNIGDWSRMRMWALAIGVAMLGFNAMVAAGWIEAGKTLYAGPRLTWLSALVGGLMFGFGMVLASGCGSKTLVRVGAGSLKSLTVMIVMGVASFATLKGVTAVLRVATVDRVALDMASGASLPQWLAAAGGWPAPVVSLLLGGGLGLALIAWALTGPGFRRADNLLAGIGLGAVVVAMWWVSGSFGHLAEHPETLQEAFLTTNSGRAEAMSFVAPVAYTLDWLMFFSDSSKVLTFAVVSVLGVIAGSAAAALRSGSFRWEGFGGVEDAANHLVGAVLMGVGGVTAMGCTIGQGLSGMSTLSLSAFVALGAIIAGAVASLKYQAWRVGRMA